MDSTGTVGTSSRFQHYKLLRRPDGSPWELGRGTMGVTYKAFDINLRCEVALKVVNPALIHHPNARERFVREARAAARLRHRNIASVYHLGNDGDRFFYAMEFIDGETLDALVRRQGPLSADVTLTVMQQVARALAAASRQGVIHRDIKPGNLMVAREDDDDHLLVKLIDFGLARAIAADDDAGNLTANGFVGTPVYSSPEQMAEKPADGRSDIYSLGVTAWFLLVGKAPFGGTVASIFQAHASRQPPWEDLPKTVPAPLRMLLARMLEKHPSRRPQSAADLRAEIDACRNEIAAAVAPVLPLTTDLPRIGRKRQDEPGPAPAVDSSASVARQPGPGMILKGRYELVRLVGEGNSGQVFLAKDRTAGDEPRALKIFRPELTDDTSKREEVAEEVRLIQGAPHPNLIRFYAFERLGSRALDFLVEEWLRGFNLRDALAARGGALPAVETLAVLGQAAAAVDHAGHQELDRLDLALHQLHVHFPSRTAGDGDAIRAFVTRPVNEWPRWILKLNPLGAVQDGLASSTWSGDVTHVPGATPALERDLLLDDQLEASSVSYLRGLARVVYELLGGVPGAMGTGPDRSSKYVSLPTVNEKANAVLQAALVEEPPRYASSEEFCAAFAEATGNVLPSLSPPTAEPPARQPVRPAYFDGPRTGAKGAVRRRVPMPAPSPIADEEVPSGRSSMSERMALVENGGRRSSGWFAAIIIGMLVLAGAAVLGAVVFNRLTRLRPATVALNTRQTPGRQNTSASPSVARATPPARPLAAVPTARPDTPVAGPTTTMAANFPPPVLSTPPPLSPATTPREAFVKVHVETKPSGAEIHLGSRLLGTTPLDASLAPGEHQLVARYRNWPEVRHTIRIDAEQSTANTEIHMLLPALMPDGESPSPTVAHVRHPPTPTPRREPPRPTTSTDPNGLIYFPSPGVTVAPSATGSGLQPFLAPTPAASRRRNPDPEPLQTENGGD